MDDFEKAVEEVSEEYTGVMAQENAIDFLKNAKTMTVFFSQPRYVSKVEKLAEQYPEEVQITAKNKDGSIVAHLPVSYLRLNRPRELSEENKKRLTEQIRRVHKDRTASDDRTTGRVEG